MDLPNGHVAYAQSPFERTVYLDGDTYVRTARVAMLFELLKTYDLAAAFECCRVFWSDSTRPYDAADAQLRGWEMQTGVLAYRRVPRVHKFWEEAARLFAANRCARPECDRSPHLL